MSRETKLQAIVLKKQDYSETDQIATLFSYETGKVRVLVKSAKLQTSKLQTSVQPGFEIKATITNSASLPKLIQVEVVKAPITLYADMNIQKIWFAASELLQRSMPDEQTNEAVYLQLRQLLIFFEELSALENYSTELLHLGLIKFQLATMRSLGLELQTLPSTTAENLVFNPSFGGFKLANDSDGGTRTVSLAYNHQLAWLKSCNYSDISSLHNKNKTLNTENLSKLVNEFINYQLEREIKSHKFLRSIL